MPEISPGLSFEENFEGFILRRKSADGAVSAITMSTEELFALKASIALWSDRTMSQMQVESGSVQPIVAHWVARVRLLPDVLQENVLLTVEAPSGEQMTFSLPLPAADCISADLPDLLAQMRAANSTKQ